MSQRGSGYERKERDLYETPEWVTEALRPHLPRQPKLIWEPAAGSGKMSSVLARWGCGVVSSDIEPHLLCYQADFLTCPIHDGADTIITNPPYELATEFVQRALGNVPNYGMVAMLLRTDFDHAKTRAHLFGAHQAFAKKVVLTKRIKWFEDSKGQPSFNHAWFIWDWMHKGSPTLAYGPEKLRAGDRVRGSDATSLRDRKFPGNQSGPAHPTPLHILDMQNSGGTNG